MSDKVIKKGNFFYPPNSFIKKAYIKSLDEYKNMYKKSIEEPDSFWEEYAETYYWQEKWNKIRDFNYNRNDGPIYIKWFIGGKTNITYNCLDRFLVTKGNEPALLWEGNEPTENCTLTYKELYQQVTKFANILKKFNLKKGDRVTIYLPMIPELVIAMLACARIGVIHNVVFAGFSAQSLRDRLIDSKSSLIITSDGSYRGNKPIALKQIVDEAMYELEKENIKINHCIVVKRINNTKDIKYQMVKNRDQWWHELMNNSYEGCEPEWMDAEDPLFILYTSGSTGKPKGVLHTIGGYMVFVGLTFKYVFDYHDGDCHWCTADIGWITGHSYTIYGPLLNGAKTLIFEGIPTYPDAGRFWSIIDKWKVNIFYTAPTAIRSLIQLGDDWPRKYNRQSLKLLGTVGEPINPEAWHWYNRVIGEERCPIVDTWWQTETGGILITSLPGAIPTKAGSATLPFFGVEPVIMNDKGIEIQGPNVEGRLVIKSPWPGQLRTTYGAHERFEKTYFSDFNNYYFTGDGTRRDEDGYFWITGRVDDVINVSGHRLGTADIESALVTHPLVAEAAVVGFPHEIKGQGIYSYITLKTETEYSEKIKKELINQVRMIIGPIATPDVIHWAPALPKTRSGKIMRRILRKIAANEINELGDTTTLADPSVINQLIELKNK